MIADEKLATVKALISPETDTDEVLEAVIEAAGAQILQRMYPFGNTTVNEVPERYHMLQCQLAVELYTKRGAEGQSSHGENGTSRVWPTRSPLLRMVQPHVGSVMTDA